MEKHENPDPKGNENGSQKNEREIRQNDSEQRSEKHDSEYLPLSWQPSIDRTTTPPKGEPDED